MKQGNNHLIAVGMSFTIKKIQYFCVGYGHNNNTNEDFWYIRAVGQQPIKREKNYMDEIINNHINENKHL